MRTCDEWIKQIEEETLNRFSAGVKEEAVPASRIVLRETLTAAVREALVMAKKAANDFRYCDLAGTELEHRCEYCAAAIAELWEGRGLEC